MLADVRRFLQMGEMEGMYLSPDGARLFTGRTAYLAYLAQQEAAGRAQQPEEPAAEAAAPTVSEVYESFLQELGAEKARIRDKEVCAKVEKLERHTRQIAACLPLETLSHQRFYVDPAHTYGLFLTHNGAADSAAVRLEVSLG